MAARFLFNSQLWDELDARVRPAKKVRAAVAYLGTGASKLLPLRAGDELVVDMSLRTVRAGATDPREVRILLRRGVRVFTRSVLHAKFIVLDQVVIAGSSNISKHARDVLDEAAILSDDSSVVARAVTTFRSLCVEPVRAQYLQKCLDEYRSPRFVPGHANGSTGPKRRRVSPRAKLWIVGGLVERSLPTAEEEIIEKLKVRAQKKLLDFERSEIDETYFASLPKQIRAIREDDWIICCVRDGRGWEVYPPARFIGIESYSRGRENRHYLMLAESPRAARMYRWTDVRALARGHGRVFAKKQPRTTPITDDADADAVLRLWNGKGQLRGRR